MKPEETPARWLRISTSGQRLELRQGEKLVACYSVSTGKNGIGEQEGSGCTPRGWHRIRLKIGAGCAANTVFVGRRPTGEIYQPALAQAFPQRDWVLSRILWLTGLEPGNNRGGPCDTLKRFIYIHGTPDSEPLGVPLSHGCIRMHSPDLISLFDQVEKADPVLITEED
jgi:lipoprotein-anchoring transpeptidase ErfK/SrfK